MDFARNKTLVFLLVTVLFVIVFLPSRIVAATQSELNAQGYADGIINAGYQKSNQVSQDLIAAGETNGTDYSGIADAESKNIKNLYNSYATAYKNLYSKYDPGCNRIDGRSASPQDFGIKPQGGMLSSVPLVSDLYSIPYLLGFYSQGEIDLANKQECQILKTKLDIAYGSINTALKLINDKYLGGQNSDAYKQKAIDAYTDANTNNNAVAQRATDQITEPIWCMRGAWGPIPIEFNSVGCFALISWSLLKVSSFGLQLTAMVFNIAIDYTLNFKNFLTSRASIVELGWTSFRDLANLFFIFILLYIGISTIVNNSSYHAKTLLVKVLLSAVLINFSLFFTQAMIDVSNIISLQFYNKIVVGAQASLSKNAGNGASVANSAASDKDSGISAGIVNALGLQDIWTLGAGSSAVNSEDVRTGTVFAGITALKLLLYGLGGSIFVLITAFILGAAAFMFIYRAITLIFLMVLSPLAFAGQFLPGTSEYAKKWWSTLMSNLIFAPVYMGLMYVVLSVVFSQAGNGGKTSFLKIFDGGSEGAEVALTFVVLSGLMWGCLMVADKFGAAGSKAASSLGSKWGKTLADKTVGATARTFIGGAGAMAANNSVLKRMASNSAVNALTLGGSRMLLRGADNLSKKKFGSGSFADSQKAREDRFARTVELVERPPQLRKKLGEKQKDYEKRVDEARKAGKARGDSVAGISVESGEVTVGSSMPFSSRGYLANQAARAKARAKNAEGKIKDQIEAAKKSLGTNPHRDKDRAAVDAEKRALTAASAGGIAGIDSQITAEKNKLTGAGNLEKLAIEATLARLYSEKSKAVADRDNSINELERGFEAAEKIKEHLADLEVRQTQAASK